MRLITRHDLPDQIRADHRIHAILPAEKFVLHIKTILVAEIEEGRIGWIVRQAHCVHVHGLDEQNVLKVFRPAQRASGLRPEGVPVHALDENAPAVDPELAAAFRLDGAEPDLLDDAMDHVARLILQLKRLFIKVRRLGRPQSRVFPLLLDRPHRTVGHMDDGLERSVRARIHGHVVDEFPGLHLEIHRPPDSAKEPVVSGSLRAVHAFVA